MQSESVLSDYRESAVILESELALCRELLKLRSNVHVVDTLFDMQYGLLVHSTKILSGRLNLWATQCKGVKMVGST